MARQSDAPRYPLRLSRRMLPADAFFWYAEAATPRLRPLVAGLFLLDRPPDPKRLRASMSRLVACIPRLRQKVVESRLSLALPEWQDDPSFDVDYHFRRLSLPPPADERHLFDLVSAVFASPLDNMRPLWEGYLLDGLEGGRAALFLKLHHSVLDGAGSLALFDALTQAGRDDAVARAPRAVRASRAGAPEAPAAAFNPVGDLLRGAARALVNPGDLVEQLTHGTRQVQALWRDATAERVHDPLAARTTGIGRRLDGVALSMKRFQDLKTLLGVPLNDVVLLAVSGALGRYHEHRGISLDAVPCMVPMSLREEGERHRLGNHVGAFRVMLPVRERSQAIRLAGIHAQTHAAKQGRQGAAYGAMMKLVSLIPAAVFRAAAESISGRVHLICSNVPGPRVERYLAGAKIDAVFPFAPVMLGTPLSIALISYGDRLGFGIDSDPAALPDPERVRRFLVQELDDIEKQARRGTAGAALRRGRAPGTTSSSIAGT